MNRNTLMGRIKQAADAAWDQESYYAGVVGILLDYDGEASLAQLVRDNAPAKSRVAELEAENAELRATIESLTAPPQENA